VREDCQKEGGVKKRAAEKAVCGGERHCCHSPTVENASPVEE